MVADVNGAGAGSVKPLSGQTGQVEPSSKGQPATTTAPPNPENVTLTDLAARLQALTKSLERLPEVDREKVAELQKSVAEGSYRIDARQVADKLAAFETLLAQPGENE